MTMAILEGEGFGKVLFPDGRAIGANAWRRRPTEGLELLLAIGAQAALAMQKTLPIVPTGQAGVRRVTARDVEVPLLAVKRAEVFKVAIPSGFQRHPLDAQHGQSLAVFRGKFVAAGGLTLAGKPDAQR